MGDKFRFGAKVEHVHVHFLQQSQLHIAFQQQGRGQLQHNLLVRVHCEHIRVKMRLQSLMHLKCIELLVPFSLQINVEIVPAAENEPLVGICQGWEGA